MDTTAHHFLPTVSCSSFVPSHRQNFSHNVLYSSSHCQQRPQNSLQHPATPTPQQPDSSFQHTYPPSRPTASRILALISKFEELDANSLSFNIRAAQPPHLQLPGSRMGRHGQGLDVQQMRATRERLLTAFDRPGWGANTLRGLKTGDNSTEVHDNLCGERREATITKTQEAANAMKSLLDHHDDRRTAPYTRPRLRRESMIMDRIRFFDGGKDFLPLEYKNSEKQDCGEGAVPSRRQAMAPPKTPRLYSVFPPKYPMEALTPVKSYGYLRPADTTPLPWRPLDPRRWKMVAHQINHSNTSSTKVQNSGQAHRYLSTPTPTNILSAVKRVQITHQNPTRNLSEKVNLQYAAISDADQEQIKCDFRDDELLHDSDPFIEVLHNPKSTNESHLGSRVLVGTEATLHNIGFETMERLKTSNKSKIQDRIKLFDKKGYNMEKVLMPMARMRNQSTPTKLPSQMSFEPPPKRIRRLHIRSQSIQSWADEGSIFLTSVAPAGTNSQTLDQRFFKQHAQELVVRDSAPRKSFGIGDKIQHFESFNTSNPSNIGTVCGDGKKKMLLSPSKRIQTWSLPNSITNISTKVEQTAVPTKYRRQIRGRSEIENMGYGAVPDGAQTQNKKKIKGLNDQERAKQKILSHQERLNRQSRSRSRSRASVAGLVGQREEPTKLIGRTNRLDDGIEETNSKATEAEQRTKKEQIVFLDTKIHQPHIRDERVQEIWIDGSEIGSSHETAIVDAVVAQCELREPRPMRLAETLRIMKLCRGRIRERSATWRRTVGKSAEKEGGLVT